MSDLISPPPNDTSLANPVASAARFCIGFQKVGTGFKVKKKRGVAGINVTY
jgi:hypothetical protein